MKLFACALLVSCGVLAASADKWPSLHTTFGLNPFDGEVFKARPLTTGDAEDAGWQLIASCDGVFHGHRYGLPDDPSLVLIFDDAGYIAGSQSGLRKAEIDNTVTPVETNPAYQLGAWLNGEEIWYTTAYFVDPAIICNGGRTEEQFSQQGVGDRLMVHNGDLNTLIAIPMTQDEADADPVWYDHYCFVGMGDHYMTFNYQPDQDCASVYPLQILYDGGKINGFVWMHMTFLSGDKWEHPDAMAVGAIIDSPPDCVGELIDYPGLSTMHHYFYDMPYLTLCPLRQKRL